MTTLFGVLLLVGGFTVLAVVRPWQSDDRARREVEPPVKGGSPPSRPRPGPRRGTALTEVAEAGSDASATAVSSTVRTGETTGGTAVRGSATVLGAARRPRPMRGVPGEAPSPVRGSVAEASDPVRGSAADMSSPVRDSVAEVSSPVRDSVSAGVSGSVRDSGSAEGSSPVVPLKPRPAARRAEPRPDRVRHHRVESIQRGRRVSAEPGDTEIVLPEWLGPMSVPGDDAAPVRARHAG